MTFRGYDWLLYASTIWSFKSLLLKIDIDRVLTESIKIRFTSSASRFQANLNTPLQKFSGKVPTEIMGYLTGNFVDSV